MINYKFISLFVFAFIIGGCSQTEKILIKNKRNNEKIYFIRYIWGLDDEITVISLSPNYRFPQNLQKNYYCREYSPFFYGFKGDTLLIYGREFNTPIENKFKTPIKNIVIDNVDHLELMENNVYIKKKLSIFPPSEVISKSLKLDQH